MISKKNFSKKKKKKKKNRFQKKKKKKKKGHSNKSFTGSHVLNKKFNSYQDVVIKI